MTKPWHATVLTLFPEMFPPHSAGVLGSALAGKALDKDIWSLETIQMREFATDKHRTVDDTPYGGGAGMVMRADVIDRAIQSLPTSPKRPIIYLSPRGEPLTQDLVKEFSEGDGITLLCGRYEGVDQRVVEHWNMREVSLGDYILSGGEAGAMTLLDACVRLLPGVLSNQETHSEESFMGGLLEYSHYTRPHDFYDKSVPSVLLSGHHDAIRLSRLAEAERVTRERRPDLWEKYIKNQDDT
ncbi:MAG: tRNA (guanosine(37)-N1)-methyltransferase TrmD [Alphaproteobacteria bacterium]